MFKQRVVSTPEAGGVCGINRTLHTFALEYNTHRRGKQGDINYRKKKETLILEIREGQRNKERVGGKKMKNP